MQAISSSSSAICGLFTLINVIVNIFFAQKVEAAVPNNFFIDNRKVLADIIQRTKIKSCPYQIIDKNITCIASFKIINVMLPGENSDSYVIFLLVLKYIDHFAYLL